MDAYDFADMVEQTPVDTVVVEYREPHPAADGGRGRLVGACVTDKQSDGLSMVYSFFAPDDGRRPAAGGAASATSSSSTTSSARSAPACRTSTSATGSRAAPQMDYKTRFAPVERLGPKGWERGSNQA